ncbi:hypothetical protein CQ12_06060 [Bradyrhizobium jicamae]|uniref:CSD domain-containing protein n=1 Tax=Bradyrhizobium jicamae TaxID=280332 RepID=A0A0R3LZ42_9BRAD|nr:cold shock domain-containing protein [Bradyrhizobium jicamae]KRR09974.1 hypothetical protein CQ12_06060 [Bradyrhizobium jicamae]
MNQGRVLNWNPDRFFGFIRNDNEREADVFCHGSALPRGVDELKPGDRVSFDTEISKRTGKMQATNVRVLP